MNAERLLASPPGSDFQEAVQGSPYEAFLKFLNEPWRLKAACRGEAPRDGDAGPHVWFPEWGESRQPAREKCYGCPVRVECLEFAMDSGERFGIWGGLSRIERRYCQRLVDEGVPIVVAMLQAQNYRALKRELGEDPMDDPKELEF